MLECLVQVGEFPGHRQEQRKKNIFERGVIAYSLSAMKNLELVIAGGALHGC